MSEYKEAQLLSFRNELRKLSWVPPRILGSVGAGAGVGVGIGGAVGGAVGGLRSYREARAQGATRGQAAMGGLGGAMQGAGKGALIGGAVGGLGGAAYHGANPVAAEKLRASLSDSSAFARFGQRQMHGLTGYTPEQGLASIRHGASTRLPAVRAAEDAVTRAGKGEDVRTVTQTLMGRDSKEVAAKQLERAQAAHAAGVDAERMGLTSVPGYVKSLASNPVGTVTTAAKDQWAGSSRGMKAMMVGLPALQLGSAAMQNPRELDARGQTRGQAIGEAATSMASGMLMSPLPMVTQIAASTPLNHLGRKAGRLLDRRGVQPAGEVMPAAAGGV